MLRDVLISVPSWRVGETTDEREARSVPVAAHNHYPDDYAGKVVAVRPLQWRWTKKDLDGGRKVVQMELTDQEAGWLVARTRKIVNGKREEITFEDRWGGVVAARLRERFDDAEDAELKSLTDPDDYDGRMFAAQSVLFKKLLPKNVVHTGAGLYEVGPAKTYSTWSSALAQLFTDQGSASFTEIQYIRGFADTYVESVTPSASLLPNVADNFPLVLEGDSSDSRGNIVVAAAAGEAFDIRTDLVVIRHLTATGNAGADAINANTGAFRFLISDCVVNALFTRDAVDTDAGITVIEDCVINAEDRAIVASLSLFVRRCIIQDPTGSSADSGIDAFDPMTLEGTVIRGFARAVSLNTTAASLEMRNCVLYDCAIGLRMSSSNAQPATTLTNNIFLDCTSNFQFANWLDEASLGQMGATIFTMHNNLFFGDTNFAINRLSATKTYAQVVAMDGVTAEDNLNATDPDLADAPGGDFTPNVGSPVILAGRGASTVSDVNGDVFDKYHPDIGAVSTGAVPPPVAPGAPTWPANTSNIVATDLALDGEVGLAWDAATPDASGDVGYIIEARTAAGPGAWGELFRTIQLLEIAAGLTNTTSYDFRVKAYTRIATEDTTTPADTDDATPTASAIVIPEAPEIEATDQLNQQDVLVEVEADNPADVSTIYYQIRPGGVVQTWGNTITGDGSETLTLTVAPYAIYAVAARGGCNSVPSNIEYLTVAAANEVTNYRTALREWVKGVVGNPEVVWRESNAPESIRPYVTIKMGPILTVGSDHHGGNDETGVETVAGDREFVFSIQVHGKQSDEDEGEVVSMLNRIRSSLEKRSVQATLCAASLAFVAVEGSSDLAGIGGTRWEARAFIDIRFGTTYSDTDDVGQISTVETPAGTLE